MLCAFWALYASVAPLARLSDDPAPPLSVISIAGITVVQSRSDAARDAGIDVGDRVLAVDGVSAAYWMRNSRSGVLIPGIPNTYFIEKRDESRIAVGLLPDRISWRGLKPGKFVDAAAVITGWIYLTIGIIVWVSRRGRREAWAFLLFCSMVAIQLSIIRETSMGWAFLRTELATPLLTAAAFHLFSRFPSEPEWVARHPGVRRAVFAGSLVVCTLILFQVLIGFPPGLIATLSFDYSCLVTSACVAMLLNERRRSGEPQVSDAIDIMLLSVVVSFLPLLLAVLAQVVLRTSFPLPFTLFWLLIFPLAAGYAIMRRNTLLEIGAAAKTKASYGLMSLAVTALVGLLITFANAAVSGFDFGTSEYWYSVGYLFIAILIFNPVRSRLQEFVDRVFDVDRTKYHLAVGEVSDAMVSMLSVREIVNRILVALTDTMGVRRAMVLLLDEEKLALDCVASRGDWEEELTRMSIPSDHPIEKFLWVRREPISILDFEEESDEEVRAACEEIFHRLGLQFMVPILFGADLLGVVAVGEKISGDRFDRHDRELLGTLANQSAVAIENAKVFDELGTLNETLEARVEARTSELQEAQAQLIQNEKMVSLGQLVAGVAHELNNPIGFVHANLQLIDEHMKKLIRAEPDSPEAERARNALDKLVSRSREGTERVKQIVEDLRTFSRLDHADLSEVDLNHCIDSTVSLMEPRLKHLIEVEKNYQPLPAVRCFAGQLNQVFMNLLANACDAMDGEGTILIETRPTEGGVQLRFTDSGPGISDEIRTRLFDPFFTTKEVGKGTGLGLSLSHGIIERHGGRISAEPGAKQRGACFVIDLPLDVEQPQSEEE